MKGPARAGAQAAFPSPHTALRPSGPGGQPAVLPLCPWRQVPGPPPSLDRGWPWAPGGVWARGGRGRLRLGWGFRAALQGDPPPRPPAHPAQCQALARGSSSVLGGGREARALSLVPGLSQQDKRGMSSGHKPCARCRRRMAWAAPRTGKPRRRPCVPPAPRLPGPAAPVSTDRGQHGAVAWTARPSHARGLAG